MCLKFIDFPPFHRSLMCFYCNIFAATRTRKWSLIYVYLRKKKPSCVSCVITIHYVWEFFSPIGNSFLYFQVRHILEHAGDELKNESFKAKMEIYCGKIDFQALTISELDIWPFLSTPLWLRFVHDIFLCSRQ